MPLNKEIKPNLLHSYIKYATQTTESVSPLED